MNTEHILTESSFHEGDDVKVIEPDFALKKKIGHVDIKQVFSEENIAKAQDVIATHTASFLEWVKNDLNMLEEHYRSAVLNIPACAPCVQALAKVAFGIKSQAGTFGYTLATLVAKSLDDFCNHDFKPTAEHLTVIRKHIDTLQVIFSKNITGDGSALGAELLGTLQKLVAKYQTKA